MVKCSFVQAKKFLDTISPKDNVVILHDTDPDGMSAGVIMMDVVEARGCSVVEYGFVRSLSSLSKFDFSSCTKVIILDLGGNLLDGLNEIVGSIPTLLIDHHSGEQSVFGENILEYRTASGICTSRSVFELTNHKEWLAIIGAFSDAGEKYAENKEWFAKFTKRLDISLDEFKNEYCWLYSSLFISFGFDMATPFKILRTFSSYKDIRKYEQYWGPVEKEKKLIVADYEKKYESLGPARFFFFKPHYDIKSPVINVISFARPEVTYIFAVPKGDKRISISARSQTGKYNLPELLKFAVAGLKDSGSGGHPAAAGAYFDASELEAFKTRVREYFAKR